MTVRVLEGVSHIHRIMDTLFHFRRFRFKGLAAFCYLHFRRSKMIRLGIRSAIRRRVSAARQRKIYARVSDYTMIPVRRFCANLSLAETVLDIPGCIVECGVWRGGMSAGLCLLLGSERDYFLFDSF